METHERPARSGKNIDDRMIKQIKPAFQGEVIRPGDKDYDVARKVWNGMIDKYPALILRCKHPDDVVSAVNLARKEDLLVSVRGGGHNVAGYGTNDGGVVIDLSPMKEIRVDTAARTAKAQPGLTWAEFDSATQAHGLATTGGLVSTTGIAGFTLGGGIGWLMRKCGLTCDNLLSAEVVTADGHILKASPTENKDLYWGLRGGGGNFGIVTSFEYRLFPVGPNVYGGAAFYPLDQAEKLLQFFRRWTPDMPDEMTTLAAFITAPPEPFIPSHLQGTPVVAVAMCYAGRVEQGEKLAKDLLDAMPPAVNLLGPIPYLNLQKMFDAGVPHGVRSYWKTEYLKGLDDGVIRAILEAFQKVPSPFTAVHIHQFGGVASRTNSTAFSHRKAPYIVNMVGGWMDPADNDKNVAWVRQLWQEVRPYSTGETYLNFLGDDEGEKRIKAAFGLDAYKRLVELKKAYDPANLFRLNQNIKPL